MVEHKTLIIIFSFLIALFIVLFTGTYFLSQNIYNPIFGSAPSSNIGSSNTNSSINSNCLRVVQIGSNSFASTGGKCTGFTVQIGSNSNYTNYQNACPSLVQIGSNSIYYNNVSGCNPQIQSGSGAVYCYLGSCN